MGDDRFEDHNLSHTEFFNSIDQDIENSGIDVKSDNLIDLVDNHKNTVQEALEKLERKNDSSED